MLFPHLIISHIYIYIILYMRMILYLCLSLSRSRSSLTSLLRQRQRRRIATKRGRRNVSCTSGVKNWRIVTTLMFPAAPLSHEIHVERQELKKSCNLCWPKVTPFARNGRQMSRTAESCKFWWAGTSRRTGAVMIAGVLLRSSGDPLDRPWCHETSLWSHEVAFLNDVWYESSFGRCVLVYVGVCCLW